MKRAVFLLLFVLTAWLLALPAARVARLPAEAPGVSVSAGKLSTAGEHVAAQHAMPHVARAARVARLPIEAQSPPHAGLALERLPALRPTRDLRQALRRLQTRRRLPRLSAGEPPWW
jgi:hypothetical protein